MGIESRARARRFRWLHGCSRDPNPYNPGRSGSGRFSINNKPFPSPRTPCREPSMRKLPIQAFLALSVAASLASAQEIKHDDSPYYLQMGIGGTSTVDVDPTATANARYDTGLAFSLLAGRELGHLGALGISLEGEAYFSFMNLNKDDLTQFTGSGGVVRARGARQLSFMANLIADYPLYEDTALYFGGGVGFVSAADFDTFDTGNLNQDDNSGVAAQAKLGIKYKLGRRSDFLMGYRYYRTEAFDFTSSLGGTNSLSFEQHSLEFNLRWGL